MPLAAPPGHLWTADAKEPHPPRCRSAAPPGAPRAGLPDTATRRASPKWRRRNPDTTLGPQRRESRRHGSDAGGTPSGRSPHPRGGQGAHRDPAAGPWRREQLAGVQPGAQRPTAASTPHSLRGEAGAEGGATATARDSAASLQPVRSALSRPGGGKERRGARGPGDAITNGLGEFLDRTVGHQPLQPTTSLMPPNVEPCGDIGLRSGLVQVRQQ